MTKLTPEFLKSLEDKYNSRLAETVKVDITIGALAFILKLLHENADRITSVQKTIRDLKESGVAEALAAGGLAVEEIAAEILGPDPETEYACNSSVGSFIAGAISDHVGLEFLGLLHGVPDVDEFKQLMDKARVDLGSDLSRFHKPIVTH